MNRCLHRHLHFVAVLGALVVTAAGAQDRRSVEHALKNAPKADEARMVNASVGDLVNIRLAQLEEDLLLAPAQLPLWTAYRESVQRMIEDQKRGNRVSASESTAPKRFDGLADLARNRLAAIEEIVDAGKAL